MLAQNELKYLFDYNKETGDLIWKNPKRERFKGCVAGGETAKGIRVKINGTNYLAHHLIYMYMEGYKPTYIGHIDGNNKNNRWGNLKDMSFERDKSLTQSYLREYFDYNPFSGTFCRIKSERGVPHGMLFKDVVNTDTRGYLRIRIMDKDYRIHRLAFMYMEGKMPEFVDHMNGVKTDNRWCNLRPCTQQQNQFNQHRVGKSGFKGVRVKRLSTGVEKWQARIAKDGNEITIGTYDCPKEAARAYNQKAKELFGDFAHLNEIQ